MVSQQIIMKLVNFEDNIVTTLFKPVQFNILKKLSLGKNLSDNEKRYLRGNMGKKLRLLEELKTKEISNVNAFLNSVSSYYITGLEALKHNGYGWYFEPKVMEVINTRIKGKIKIENKALRLIRVKSIGNSKYITDKTGLKYATNEQVIRDIKITKNEYAKKVWMEMFSRYKNLFSKNHNKLKPLIPEQMAIDYEKYGV